MEDPSLVETFEDRETPAGARGGVELTGLLEGLGGAEDSQDTQGPRDVASDADDDSNSADAGEPPYARAAKYMLLAFVPTVVICRLTVLMIMTRQLPVMYLNVGGKHVHHFFYGLVLLALNGFYTLLARPRGRALAWVSLVYGVALGLVFDEFSIWMDLGGPYWHKASFAAVGLVAAVLAAVAFAPRLLQWRRGDALPPRRWPAAAVLLAALLVLYALLVPSLRLAKGKLAPALRQIETKSPWN